MIHLFGVGRVCELANLGVAETSEKNDYMINEYFRTLKVSARAVYYGCRTDAIVRIEATGRFIEGQAKRNVKFRVMILPERPTAGLVTLSRLSQTGSICLS
jgi:hypothetical protein